MSSKKTKSTTRYKTENLSAIENSAVVTHYLHSIGTNVSKYYKNDAEKSIKKYIEYKSKEENVHIVAEEAVQQLLFEVQNIPFPAPQNSSFTFIDLFAGVGGFRLAMQNLGGKCVFSSEWNTGAQETYKANFGDVPFGDITKPETKKYIPKNFDILCAGFPCQAFSIAGYRKGFSDTRGTLFFDLEQIIEEHRPKAIFLENVKNLQSHDNGKTFRVMYEILTKKLGYIIHVNVLNSLTHANIPQNRERIFIVGFDPKQLSMGEEFKFPIPIQLTKSIHDVIEHDKKADIFYYPASHQYYPELKKMMTKDTIYQWRRMYLRENKNKVCPTLTANMGGGGHNVPLIMDDFGYRKLTPRECFSFQGYPKKFILPKSSNSKLYMQAGNSVTVPLIERVGKEILKLIKPV